MKIKMEVPETVIGLVDLLIDEDVFFNTSFSRTREGYLLALAQIGIDEIYKIAIKKELEGK